jgi:hypothetical protein
MSSCGVPVILVRFDEKLDFLDRFFEKSSKCQISLKSVQWELPSCSMRTDIHGENNTDIRRLMSGIRSEKRVVRRFRRCANVIECPYTNLVGIAYCTPGLYGIAYCS